MIKIAIAEDNSMALESILSKLQNFKEISIAGVAYNGKELVKLVENTPTDLVLMDIEMPIMDGIQATAEVKSRYPAIKILMLTTFDDDDKIFNAILAGANGYLLKDESETMLYQSITDTLNGGAAMSSSIALKTLNYIKNNPPVTNHPHENILSPREIEILTGLKNGLGYKQIAGELFISEGTVRKHIENIYRKLEVNNKVSAINAAVKNKWV